MSYLLDLLYDYAEARGEVKECNDGCEYDAGYFCYEKQQALDNASSRFEEELKSIIKEVINEG